MAVIRCRGKLWQRLGRGRTAHCASEAAFPGVLLGSWAAKLFSYGGRDLILAINERTYLSVVLPRVPRERFFTELANAVGTALRDLRVPEAIVRSESNAVEFMPVARLGSGELADVLDDVQFYCELELQYHTDLRIVQRNLNDVPHPNRDPRVPLEAVRALFQNAGESPAWLRSIA